MPIRLRVALFGAGLVMLAMLLFSLLVYTLAALGAADQRDRELTARCAETAAAAADVADPELLAAKQPVLPATLFDSSETFVFFVGHAGEPLGSSGPLRQAAFSVPASVLDESTQRGAAPATTQGLRIKVCPIQAGFVVAARSAGSVQAQMAGLRGFLIVAGLVILVAALLASWLTAGQALKPLDSVARLMEEIGLTRDLGRRLPPTRTHDEVGRLTEAFNRMLQRLQATQQQLAGALDAQRRFVADSSHELRTPLTTVRTNAGMLLQRGDMAEEDRRAALVDIASESERMGRLVNDLLLLARADAGHELQHAPVELAALVEEVAGQAGRAYLGRSISAWSERVVVVGDVEALTQLLWILLDNAAKFTLDGGRIDVRLGLLGAAAELTVSDDGCGIADADVVRIFDRFYRADSARSGGGAGLGLSIARWIVAQHSGTIAARSRAGGGAIFTVTLPLADS